jgi:hypothetical protein
MTQDWFTPTCKNDFILACMPLKSSFRKFYGRYDDLVCDYRLSQAHMLIDLFHTLCLTVISILAFWGWVILSTKGAQRVWPVSMRCLLLRGTWSCLCVCRGFILHYTRFCICVLDYDYILCIVNFPILCKALSTQHPKMLLHSCFY